MPKVPTVRRSNRDRHAVYSSLQENSIGISLNSNLFRSLYREASRRHEDLSNHNYGTRSNRSRRFEDYEDAFSPALKSREVSDNENNDENLPTSSRPRRMAKKTVYYDDEFEDEEELVKRPKRRPERKSLRNSDTKNGTSNETLEELEADQYFEDNDISSLSERVKRRRQSHSQNLAEEDEEPENKRVKVQTNRNRDVPLVEDDEDSQDVQEESQLDKNGADPEARSRSSSVPEEGEGRKYFFRRNRSTVNRLQDEYASKYRTSERLRRARMNQRNRNDGNRRRSTRHHKSRNNRESFSSTDSSDSDDMAEKDLKAETQFERRKLKSLEKGRSQFLPLNMNAKEWKQRQQLNNLISVTGGVQSTGDIEPMNVDKTTKFSDIGGLDGHIQSLKEIVAFPLQYPELFQKFSIQAPKGVLFYGPPGTGKTLVARALANECSKEGKKVTFFMRKGADCMSKWVGESERQLRLLFDQAYQMRPSIIFFDEIDGLAPVRSSRQDQIHSSIVSTLLALMDGLDNRGQVVVIGATNRIDSIDPALRRPGRFDRELRFDLPDKNARRTILNIHTTPWIEGKPSDQVLDLLSEKTSGYCGADLKALCTETVLVALRNRYPHIYVSNEKLELDTEQIKVEGWHFDEALRRIVPSSRRGFTNASFANNHKTDVFIEPFVSKILQNIPSGYIVRQTFSSNDPLQKVVDSLQIPPVVPATRLLLHANGNMGQTKYFLNAFTSHLDHLPLFSFSYSHLYRNSQPEEALSSIMLSITQATNRGSAALLIIPDLDELEKQLPQPLWHMLITSLKTFDGFTPLLVIASSQMKYTEMNGDIKQLFRLKDTVEVEPPCADQTKLYFTNLLKSSEVEPKVFDASKYPTPPVAVAVECTAPNLTEEELVALEKVYEQMLRQLRIFLRDILAKLIRDRRFSAFNLPVTTEEAEDYFEVIEKPMCLSDMMNKIDHKEYDTASAFLADIDLIQFNCLEYNPGAKLEHKMLRHAAVALVDTTAGLFDAELDEKFEEKLQDTARIIAETKERLSGKKITRKNSKNEKNDDASKVNGVVENGQEDIVANGENVDEDVKKESGEVSEAMELNVEEPANVLVLDKNALQEAIETAVIRTTNWPIQDIEALGVALTQIVQFYQSKWDRSELPKEIKRSVLSFEQE